MKAIMLSAPCCLLWTYALFTKIKNPHGLNLFGVSPIGLRKFVKTQSDFIPLRSDADFNTFGDTAPFAFNDIFDQEFTVDEIWRFEEVLDVQTRTKCGPVGQLVVEDADRWKIPLETYIQYVHDIEANTGIGYDQSHGAIGSFLLFAFEYDEAVQIGSKLIAVMEGIDFVQLNARIRKYERYDGELIESIGWMKSLTIGKIPLSLTTILLKRAYMEGSFDFAWEFVEAVASEEPKLIRMNKELFRHAEYELFYVIFAGVAEQQYAVKKPLQFYPSKWKIQQNLEPDVENDECSFNGCDDFVEAVCKNHRVFVCEDHLDLHKSCEFKLVEAEADGEYQVSVETAEELKVDLGQARQNTVWASFGSEAYRPQIWLGIDRIQVHPDYLGSILQDNRYCFGVIGDTINIEWNQLVVGMQIAGVEGGSPFELSSRFDSLSSQKHVPITLSTGSGTLKVIFLGGDCLFPAIAVDLLGAKQQERDHILTCDSLLTMHLRSVKDKVRKASQINDARVASCRQVQKLIVMMSDRCDGKPYACPVCQIKQKSLKKVIKHLQYAHVGSRSRRFCMRCCVSFDGDHKNCTP